MKIISLGWGVQSWTLAAMVATANTGCSCPVCAHRNVAALKGADMAIHSDTTFEMAHTYAFAEQWTQWLVDRGVPVVTVRDTRATHIMKKSATSEGTYTLMPVFTLNEDGTKGQLRRQCTSRWKIEPLHRWLGDELKRREITKSSGVITQYLGISLDEWNRMKTSPVDWIANAYPLVDMRMTRGDCLAWLEAHNLPSPGKSACAQCPYRSPKSWSDMQTNQPEDWDAAIRADEQLRATGRNWYLHPARIPLAEVVKPADKSQLRLWDDETDPTCDSGHCFL
jgi:hypothetical protein